MVKCVRSVGFGPSVVCGSVVVLLALATGLTAAEEKGQLAVADMRLVDEDYGLLGEFTGTISTAKQDPRTIGLQIRAVGKGRFQAAQFEGGLPGEARAPQRPTWLVGKRNGEFMVLSGGPWAILVHPDHCLLVDQEGQSVGRLQRATRESPTLGAGPPKQATVLFDGSGTDQFSGARLTDSGLLMEGANVLPLFQDFDLHLEFMLPYMSVAAGQSRANSGVYLQSRYEVQILDSFAMRTTFNGCGAIYRFRKPDVNMCLPPLVWQTYDISFTAPRWAADGTKRKSAQITVWLNGVKIHDNAEISRKTGAGAEEEVALLPIRLQDHGAPVRFRNIWIIDRGAAGWAKFPVEATVEERARARAAVGATCAQSAPREETPSQPAAQQPTPAQSEAQQAPAVEPPAVKPQVEDQPKQQPNEQPAAEKPAAETANAKEAPEAAAEKSTSTLSDEAP